MSGAAQPPAGPTAPTEARRGVHDLLRDPAQRSWAKYRRAVVGEVGTGAFLWYELCTGLFGDWPGALGYWLRGRFYPSLFRSCGRQVIFGRGLTLRHPRRITIGHRVTLSDGVVLDAKGNSGEGIVIGDEVFIGLHTVVTTTDGTIELARGCNIGAWCRIGSYGRTRIGEKALLAAWVYVVGAGHETSRTDIPILDQPYTTRGGAEVGDGAWIGAKATVMDGTKVGAHAIVGAHALVTADVPAWAIAVGIPARVTGFRPGAPVS
ncbi:MAG: hypothetical protein N2652_02900 [Kiritimatiellae bacterium]|nr:hypothetical protein [Kiritimatiellia bacterium]